MCDGLISRLADNYVDAGQSGNAGTIHLAESSTLRLRGRAVRKSGDKVDNVAFFCSFSSYPLNSLLYNFSY